MLSEFPSASAETQRRPIARNSPRTRWTEC